MPAFSTAAPLSWTDTPKRLKLAGSELPPGPPHPVHWLAFPGGHGRMRLARGCTDTPTATLESPLMDCLKSSRSHKTWVWIVIKMFCPLTGSFTLPPLCNQIIAIQLFLKIHKRWCRKHDVVGVPSKLQKWRNWKCSTMCPYFVVPFPPSHLSPGDSSMWICED